jgi:hypothetical protein
MEVAMSEITTRMAQYHDGETDRPTFRDWLVNQRYVNPGSIRRIDVPHRSPSTSVRRAPVVAASRIAASHCVPFAVSMMLDSSPAVGARNCGSGALFFSTMCHIPASPGVHLV